MAIGDDALAAGMQLVSGSALANTLDTEENRTRDYIAQRTDAPGTPRPVAKGGTGADNAAAARTNLGVLAAGVTVKRDAANAIELFWGGPGNLRVGARVDGSPAGFFAYTSDVGGGGGSYLPLSGGTVTGDLNLPNSTPATSGYTVAYIDGTGRIARGASSERYKDHITPIDPATLGDIFPELHTFTMRQDETNTERVGWIAERLAESADLERFVVRDMDGLPDSIDFISLLQAQNAWLQQAVQLLAGRIERLEGRA